MSCHIIFCHVTYCHGMLNLCHLMSKFDVKMHYTSRHVTHATIRHVMFTSHDVWRLTMSYYLHHTLYHVMSLYITIFHVISCHSSIYITSHHILLCLFHLMWRHVILHIAYFTCNYTSHIHFMWRYTSLYVTKFNVTSVYLTLRYSSYHVMLLSITSYKFTCHFILRYATQSLDLHAC